VRTAGTLVHGRFYGRCGGQFTRAEQAPDQFELFGAVTVSQKAEGPNVDNAGGENVLQESPQEFLRRERYRSPVAAVR